jgi:hypothetical protein
MGHHQPCGKTYARAEGETGAGDDTGEMKDVFL